MAFTEKISPQPILLRFWAPWLHRATDTSSICRSGHRAQIITDQYAVEDFNLKSCVFKSSLAGNVQYMIS